MAEQEVKKVEETPERPKLEVVQHGALVLEVKNNDLLFSLSLPVGATYADAYYATFEMLKAIEGFVKKAEEEAKKKEESGDAVEQETEEAKG